MDRRKTICVIMSTYNGEKYLRSQIDTILNQKDVQIVLYIRDDGSCDHTVDIIKELQRKNKNIILDEGDNIGWKKSFIKALKDAPETDYYAFSDQDDYWMPTKICKCVNRLEKVKSYEKPMVCIANAFITDKDLNILHKYTEDKLDVEAISFQQFWAHPSMPGGCSMVFNKKTRDYALRMRDYAFGHDNLIERICGLMGGVYYLDAPLMYYRQHGNNTIGASVKKITHLKNIFHILFSGYDYDRSISASQFLETFNDDLSGEEKAFLINCRDAHFKLRCRINIFMDKKFRKSDIKNTIALKIKILLGKY